MYTTAAIAIFVTMGLALVRALAAQSVQLRRQAMRDRHTGGAREGLEFDRPAILPALLQVEPSHPPGVMGQQRPDGMQPEYRDRTHRRARPPFERRGWKPPASFSTSSKSILRSDESTRTRRTRSSSPMP